MKSDIQEKLNALAKAYALQLPAKVEEMVSSWAQLKNEPNSEEFPTLIRHAHSLCGTAGTYGYQLVSSVARKLELKMKTMQTEPSEKLQQEIADLLQDLQQLVLKPSDIESIPQLQVETQSESDSRLIYILQNSKDKIDLQLEQAKQFSYIVKMFSHAKDFINIVSKERPDMVIMDIELAQNIPDDVLKHFHDEMIFIIYSSNNDDLMARLFTVRHYGQAFIALPLDVNNLIHLMDSLFDAKQSHDARILIVDDSTFIGEYYATVLEQVGMITNHISDPKLFLATLEEFQPDLILMDINMPFCSGTELAQIVHQQETLSSIPIIFLSTIAERAKQLEVLSVAGDDFLTKPIEPKHLLAAVRSRLMRSRILRSRMMRDSLTNLYNHTMIHHQLEREITIASRYETKLSIVLFDLDHFKSVNDTYGHQAGDKVLKDLSAFLLKHLRKCDLVGRYGGEEFLVVLPNTAPDQAFKIVDDLRSRFGMTSHQIGETEIVVTLSGGLASYPAIQSSAKLIKAADDALYEAKENGRNRIGMAEERATIK